MTFHEVAPAFIEIRGDRALANSGMTLHLILTSAAQMSG
jgi:hypothetical protein